MTLVAGPIDQLYAAHPLREATILARLARTRGTLEGLDELDLAHDSVTEITDQNHVGGIGAVIGLAVRAGVTPASRVLDLGSGLGGSVRALARLFGCRAHGIELTRQRHEDAIRLTERVGLAHAATFSHGDALTAAIEPASVDVVWGQGAWMHVADTAALCRVAARALVPDGRVAFDEVCLRRGAQDADERRRLIDLERLWGGRVIAVADWTSALAAASCAVRSIDDETGAFVAYFERLARIARREGAGLYPASEIAAFDEAIALARAGVLQYVRVVAVASR